MRVPLNETHPDFQILSLLRDEIAQRAGGLSALTERFPELIRDSIDFLLDPVRTARTRLHELDNVEKTFIGLKLEHCVRDLLEVPKGRRDLVVAGIDVDIKNTVRKNWSIPQETYLSSEPCLLMMVNEEKCQCWLGLIIAKLEYLHKGKGNRDTKKGVSAAGFKNILWIVDGASFPPMVSLCFLFEPAKLKIKDDTGLTKNTEPAEGGTPPISNHVKALRKAMAIENLDIVLSKDPAKYDECVEQTKKLLARVGYPVDDSTVGYDTWLASL